jgi:hypothetical protein
MPVGESVYHWPNALGAQPLDGAALAKTKSRIDFAEADELLRDLRDALYDQRASAIMAPSQPLFFNEQVQVGGIAIQDFGGSRHRDCLSPIGDAKLAGEFAQVINNEGADMQGTNVRDPIDSEWRAQMSALVVHPGEEGPIRLGSTTDGGKGPLQRNPVCIIAAEWKNA